MCKTEVETWEHYDYDCEQVTMYMGRLSEVYEYYMEKMDKDMGIWTMPTREEWNGDGRNGERQRNDYSKKKICI